MARAAAGESGGGNPRDAFRAAFGAAKASHSRLDTEAAESHDDEVDLTGGEDDDDPDDGAADEGDEDEGADDEGDEGEGDDEDEGDGDGDDDAGDDEDDDDADDEGEGDADDEDDDEKPELLTDAEIKQIQRKFPNDPGKQIKAFQAAFTRKTQDLASARKKYSAYEQYYDLIDAMDERPAAILKRLGGLYGLEVNIGKGKGKGAADETDDAADETDTAAAAELTGKARDKALEEMRELLGPELEYQAEALLNVFEKFQGKRTKAMLERELKPLKQQNDQTIDQLADDKTNRLMKRMGKRHTDWDEHEDEMLALSKKLSPNGMSMEEYLEHLYQTVTRGKRDDRARKLKKKLKRQERVNPAEARGARRSATPDTQVRRRARRNATFQDAYQAARRGERWDAEDDD